MLSGEYETEELAAQAHDREETSRYGDNADTNFDKSLYLSQSAAAAQSDPQPQAADASQQPPSSSMAQAAAPAAPPAQAANSNKRKARAFTSKLDDTKRNSKYKGISYSDKLGKWRAQVWDALKFVRWDTLKFVRR